jgi:hypothetical protein
MSQEEGQICWPWSRRRSWRRPGSVGTTAAGTHAPERILADQLCPDLGSGTDVQNIFQNVQNVQNIFQNVQNIFAEKNGDNIGVFCSESCLFLQKFDHNIGFKENANYFGLKVSKMAENYYYKIGTTLFRLTWFGLTWFGLTWFGLTWFGLMWFGLMWFGLTWFGLKGVWSKVIWSNGFMSKIEFFVCNAWQ